MPLLYNEEIQVYWILCGSDDNNAYLIVSPQTRESIIIDAPQGPEELIEVAKGTTVRAILMTHNHRDHLEGLKEIMGATGAPVWAHSEDATRMPVTPDALVKDGDVIRAGAIEVKVLHTPGHTPGSVCYLAGKHLFSGDTLLAGGGGSTNSVEELLQTYKSITEKLYVLPDNVFLLPGHGKGSILGVEKTAYRAIAAEYPDVLPLILDAPPSQPPG